MRLTLRGRQHTAPVLMTHRLVVAITVAMNIGKCSANGAKHRLRRARVPLLASGAGEYVRMRLTLDQQQDLQMTLKTKHFEL